MSPYRVQFLNSTHSSLSESIKTTDLPIISSQDSLISIGASYTRSSLGDPDLSENIYSYIQPSELSSVQTKLPTISLEQLSVQSLSDILLAVEELQLNAVHAPQLDITSSTQSISSLLQNLPTFQSLPLDLSLSDMIIVEHLTTTVELSIIIPTVSLLSLPKSSITNFVSSTAFEHISTEIATTSNTSSNIDADGSSNGPKHLSKGKIIGIIISAVISSILFGLCIFIIASYRRRRLQSHRGITSGRSSIIKCIGIDGCP